jgi:hypothetical protein
MADILFFKQGYGHGRSSASACGCGSTMQYCLLLPATLTASQAACLQVSKRHTDLWCLRFGGAKTPLAALADLV